MEATWFGHSRSLISTNVDSSAAIDTQFDGVAYDFGASVLFMLKAYLDKINTTTYRQGKLESIESLIFFFNNLLCGLFQACETI